MASNPIKLDLDAILPQTGEITIGGVVYIVQQPSLEDLVYLTRVINGLQDDRTSTGVADTLADLHDFLPKIIPDFNARLTMQQALALIQYLFQLSAPPEAVARAEQGEEPNNEKKSTDTVS